MRVNLSNFIEIDVNKLCIAEWNYKVDNEILSEKLKNNILKNGQIENIIVRELDNGNYEVVNGNHRLKVLQDLGVKKAVCCNLGKIDEITAKRIAIETNETEFSKDDFKFFNIINEILEKQEIEDIEKTLPFTAEELQNFKDLKDFDWDSFYKEREEKYKDKGGDDTSKKDEDEDFHLIEIPLSQEVLKKWDEFKSRNLFLTDEENFKELMRLVQN